MNRWFIAGGVLLILLVASVYFFIPSHLVVNNIVPLKCNAHGGDRALGDTVSWVKWWPGADSAGSDRGGGSSGSDRGGLTYGGVGYRVSERLLRGVGIAIDDRGHEIPSLLTIFPLINKDSSYLQWQFALDASLNPLKRIGQYREATRLKENMAIILDSLQVYLENKANVYGLAITEASTTDSFLVETRRTVNGYPGTGILYDEVKKLETFATGHGGRRTGYPMVNIDPLAGGQFQLRTAIPVDRHFDDKGDFFSRKLVHGNYLEADVHGGAGAVNTALDRMNNYISDYGRTVMAIPFFSLMTDRSKEPDSTKWVTRIYYPIY
jgi:hypothetical protein